MTYCEAFFKYTNDRTSSLVDVMALRRKYENYMFAQLGIGASDKTTTLICVQLSCSDIVMFPPLDYEGCRLPAEWQGFRFVSTHEYMSGWVRMAARTDFKTDSGPRLNIKTVLSTYGDFHVKDKTAVRTSYL